MATSKLTNYATVFHFAVNISTLSSSNSVYSPTFVLSNMNWKVKFAKKSIGIDENAQVLSVFLEPIWAKKEEKWSCEAQATFTLLPKDDEAGQSLERHLCAKIFDNKSMVAHGFPDFINWDEFVQNYVREDMANFEVQISTSPLLRKRTAADDINQTSATFQVTVENASQLEVSSSNDVILQGIIWNVRLKKCDKHLAVYLYCREDDVDENWFYKANVTFTLQSFHDDVGPKQLKMGAEYQRESIGWGFDDFLEWSKFIDKENGYIKKDRAILSVDLKVDPAMSKWKIPRKTQPEKGQSHECSVCLEQFLSGEIFTIKCGHLFCKPCIDKSLKNRKVCPMCNAGATTAQIHPIYF